MSDTNEYAVQGMTCSGCATKVTTAVNEVPGVTATEVDITTGTLKVTGPEINDHAIREAIVGAGYQSR